MRIYFFVAVFLVVAACRDMPDVQPEDHGIAIKEAYDAWVKTTNQKDIDKWSEFVAADAVFLPPDSEPLESMTEIRDYYLELFRDTNFSIACEQVFVRVAKSEDLAWSRGYCEAMFAGTEANVETVSSKWAKVWERQPDGGWKCRLNTWNANQLPSR
ncbi:MAG: nuclear transport factor 2 family protein [Saprospiraceae bacterium]|nr:nuclear transport factor 2 family protein [Saprospiraceae bacterium]